MYIATLKCEVKYIMVATRLQNNRHVPLNAAGADHWHFVPPRKDPRERRQIRFWVDIRKELGEWAIETMDALKQERKFKQTMLEGFRLIVELRTQKIDYLFELFPWLEHWMDREIEREVTRRVALAQKEQQPDLTARLAALEAKLAALEQPAPTPMQPVAPRPPVDDDDDSDLLAIKQAAPGDGRAASQNFLESAFNLQG